MSRVRMTRSRCGPRGVMVPHCAEPRDGHTSRGEHPLPLVTGVVTNTLVQRVVMGRTVRPRRFPTGGQINADRVLGTPYAFEEHMWGMGTERRAKPSPTLQLCIDQHSDGMTSQRYAARRRGFALVSNMKEHYQHTRVHGIEYQ